MNILGWFTSTFGQAGPENRIDTRFPAGCYAPNQGNNLAIISKLNAMYLAKPFSYHRASKNCRYDLYIVGFIGIFLNQAPGIEASATGRSFCTSEGVHEEFIHPCLCVNGNNV